MKQLLVLLWVGILLVSVTKCEDPKNNKSNGTAASPQDEEITRGELEIKTEFENDRIRILRMHLPPKGTVPMHTLTPRAVVWLTDAYIQLTFPNGETQEIKRTSGATGWIAGGRHAGKNMSNDSVKWIVVEPKTDEQTSETKGIDTGH